MKRRLLYGIVAGVLLVTAGVIVFNTTGTETTPVPVVATPEEQSEAKPLATTLPATVSTSSVSTSTTTVETTMKDIIPEEVVKAPTTTPAASNPTTMPDTTPKPNSLTTMAWLYPSEPGCNAQKEYQDGRNIDILKPEFFTVNGGSLLLLDAENYSCNGYSPAFVADLKKYSNRQFVTVSSASTADMDTFLKSALSTGDEINTLVTFITSNNLTGIELDFEDFGGWSEESYENFLLFVDRLGTKLQAHGKKLMIDAPAITDATEEAWYAWRYEDFVTLPVDYIVIMAYDYQFDHGVGEPIAPLDWMSRAIYWASARYPKGKLAVGIPSYGYEGILGKRPFIRTYDQLKNKPGFATATRDERSGELTWQTGKNVYFYQDTESIRQKIAQVKKSGLTTVSIWHLGGNKWY